MRVLLVMLALLSGVSQAQDKSPSGQAHWLLERITGVKWPATSPLISQMAQKIQSGDSAGAADLAIAQPQFINVQVKQMALKLSTREETVRITMNDFAATFMGVARDGNDARELLYGNYYYMGNPSLVPAGTPMNTQTDLLASNNHFDSLDKMNVDYSKLLMRVDGQQVSMNGAAAANPDPAGVLTSRTWMLAHAIAGTNRRLVEYTFREFMCIPLINWADTNAPDVRVGRDVDRFPGGDNVKYETTCKGCHAMQDGFRGAFAKWNWDQANVVANYQTSGVQAKMSSNANVYPQGYVTVDDSWINNATRGSNGPMFGWRGLAPNSSGSSTAGQGTGSFGRLVANSQRFSQCMAQHVFQAVCQRQLSDADAQLLYVSLGIAFEQNKYNIKKLFEIVATNPGCRM